jgi:hypothetical protein
MKKISISMICIALVAINSCKKFLTEDPKGRVTTQYLATQQGLNDLLTACYYDTRGIVEPLGYMANAASDEWTYGAQATDIRLLTECRTADFISSSPNNTLWTSLYANINNLNYGLNTIDKTTFTDAALKTRVKAELSFLRAWQYYLAVETWGTGANYATTFSDGPVTEGHQVNIEDFYKLILGDLNLAIATLPAQPFQVGRASSFVAKALKARVLMALAGYPDATIAAAGTTRTQIYVDAKTLADDVITNSGRKLLTDYKSVFDVFNENNNEILWAVQFTSNLIFNAPNANGLHRYWVSQYNFSAHTLKSIPKLAPHSITYGREFRIVMPTKWLLQLYSPYDKRYDGSFITNYLHLIINPDNTETLVPGDTALIRMRTVVSPATYTAYANRGIPVDGLDDYYNPTTNAPTTNGRSYYIQFTKYLDPSRTTAKQEGAFKDVIVLRLAEMYLIAAECAMNQGDNVTAAQYITTLRARDLVAGHESDLAVTPAQINIDYILDERSRELAGEEIRWFDLKRTNKLVERVKKYNPDALFIAPMHNVRPVPVNEILTVTNPQSFKQNPGY